MPMFPTDVNDDLDIRAFGIYVVEVLHGQRNLWLQLYFEEDCGLYYGLLDRRGSYGLQTCHNNAYVELAPSNTRFCTPRHILFLSR